MSDCRKQIIDVITPPTIATAIIGFINVLFKWLKIIIIRASPYPPNLRRIAAKIIEPATGASTWAFGSQRCTENNGSFTKNAKIIISQISDDDSLINIWSAIVILICLDEW